MMPAATPECGEIRQALGVYVVGAIDPAERSLVDRHLAGCAACRDELAGLAGLPALLGRVTLEEAARGRNDTATDEAPPKRLVDSMLTQMARRRSARRRRNVLLAAAACVVVLAGGGAAGAVLGSATAPRPPHQLAAGPGWDKSSSRDAATNVSASVRYRPQTWGTELSVWVAGVPVGTRCQLWVIDSSGRRVVAAGWQVPNNDHAIWYPGSAPVKAGSISAFQITSPGKTLVTVSS